jgi:hypothetical protein
MPVCGENSVILFMTLARERRRRRHTLIMRKSPALRLQSGLKPGARATRKALRTVVDFPRPPAKRVFAPISHAFKALSSRPIGAHPLRLHAAITI